MKILASADIHGNDRLVEHLQKTADEKDVDVVIIAGDLARHDGTMDGLVGPLLSDKRKVCIIGGNHDTFDSIASTASQYDAWDLHDYSFIHNDVGIFGVGGANMGWEALSEKEIYDRLVANHEKVKDAKFRVMVSHVHPEGTHMENMSPFVGPSSGVRRALDKLKPTVVLCGHVHEASGIEEKIGATHVINVSGTATLMQFK